MTVLASAGDTWGIAGPAFLQLFLALAVVALLLTVLLRNRVLRGGVADTIALTPAEVAYLNRGDTLAVQTAIAGLRAAGVVDTGPGATMVATGPFPAGGGDLDYAVHETLASPRRMAELTVDRTVAGALFRLRDRLTGAGLMVSARQRSAIRWAATPMYLVLALGVARLVAGASGHKPVGYLVFADIVILIACLVASSVPRLTAHGKASLAKLRADNAHLQPKLSPSWATYGPAGAMMGVAVFGTAALWAADPAFATQAGIPPMASGGSSGGIDSSGCSSGSSCGGGSCGGGCGGGGCGG